MIKIAHITDTHLDFISDEDTCEYFQTLADIHKNVDIIVHSGDISHSHHVRDNIISMMRFIKKPIAFVLGNHDYYYSQIQNVRSEITKLVSTTFVKNAVHYLTTSEPIYVNDVCIIGHDCWYDAHHGNPWAGGALNDWRFIREFANVSEGRTCVNEDIINLARCLALEGAVHIERNIEKAINNDFKKIVVVSHVPPFAESHVFNGDRGTSPALPWYTCKALGDLLISVALDNPDVEFLSLHGHTHSFFDKKIMPNLQTRVGNSVYGNPGVGNVLQF